ncbi:hypothetical protein KFE25_001051 [Diacronema lutheri]|uniref:COX assembly mitochondrial protein n=1 Tax=Diacronema lutheri TaxID=2081491 RepID=A0A8J5XI32_DIALT|nr:hypothetical protein KFE25_001051 [Diacronema lutheri]
MAEDGLEDRRRPLTNRRKDVVRKAVYAHAFKECRAELEAYIGCMQGRMLSVVWACRPENRTMNECLHQFTNPACLDKAYEEEERRLAAKA